jgi:hypothetical protein
MAMLISFKEIQFGLFHFLSFFLSVFEIQFVLFRWGFPPKFLSVLPSTPPPQP